MLIYVGPRHFEVSPKMAPRWEVTWYRRSKLWWIEQPLWRTDDTSFTRSKLRDTPHILLETKHLSSLQPRNPRLHGVHVIGKQKLMAINWQILLTFKCSFYLKAFPPLEHPIPINVWIKRILCTLCIPESFIWYR